MILRLPRYVYRPLPEGQEYTLTKVNGEDLIVINEALNRAGRRAALRRARLSLSKGWGPAARLIAVVGGIGAWVGAMIRDLLRTKAVAAAAASALTGLAVYAVTVMDGREQPVTEPPVIVTLQPPTPTVTVTPSRKPSTGTTSRPPTARPNITTVTRPTRSAWHTRSPARTTRPTRAARTSSPPATIEELPTTSEPTTAAPPPPPASTEPTGIVTEPSRPSEPSAPADVPDVPAGDSCGGITLDVRIDPLASIDACVLG